MTRETISKREFFKKSTFVAGVGAGLVSAQAQPAYADTAFTSFSFLSTGGTTTRTMPNRIADFINVKDYGAVGNNIADDTVAIQNAINANTASGTNGNIGTIYFPRGTYMVSGPIYLPPAIPGTLAQAASFTGSISGSTLTVTAVASGALAANQTIQCSGIKPFQVIQNQVSGSSGGTGTYMLGQVTQSLSSRAMTTLAPRAIMAQGSSFILRGDGPGATTIVGNVDDFIFQSSCQYTTANNGKGFLFEGLRVVNTSTLALASGAISVAGLSFATLINCEAFGQVGFSTYDNCNNARDITFIDCLYSGSNATPPFGATDAVGWNMIGNGCNLIGCESSGWNIGASFGGIGFTMTGCHFEVNNTAVQLGIYGDLATPEGCTISILQLTLEGNGIGIDCINVSNSFIQGIYILGEMTGIGGVGGSISSYGIRARDNGFSRNVLSGASIVGVFSDVGLFLGDLSGNGSRVQTWIYGCDVSVTGGGGTSVSLPNGSQSAESYAGFYSCSFVPAWTFANLPSGSNVADGDQYDIVDSATAASGNFAANVTMGGGSNHVRVRWNAATMNWTVCG